MRFTVDSDVVISKGLTMKEFSIVLYYLWGGEGVIDDDVCESLWNKGYLIKIIDGFKIDNNKFAEIENITAASAVNKSSGDRLIDLANEMRAIFPKGKKLGTNYYWRDSPDIIAQRLGVFFKKYGNKYSNEQIITATERYVESFNGNYQFMQLLKYFISKQNKQTGEVNSELASYLANEGQDDERNWETTLK